ncbi:MAG: hypothetical protein ACOH5I_04210 [Oligoflexus sp.]
MNTQSKYVLKTGIWALTLASLVGCGRWASAPEQETNSIAIPEYPQLDSHVLTLQQGNSSVGYGGTLLIFNENASGPMIADVLQASIDSRIAWAEARKYEEESRYLLMYDDNGIVPNALRDMRAELRRFEAEALANNPVPLEEKKANTRNWFPEELDRLYGSEASSDRQRAESIWPYYCDAKIIELASNSYFAAQSYLERPSPLSFCETYYEEQGYFQGEICQAAPQGQSYFECLWREGVFKTFWFEEFYLNPAVDAERAQQVEDLLSTENISLFQDIIALNESVMDVSNAAVRRFIFGPNGDKKTYFSELIMTQAKATPICTRAIPDLRSLCTIFELNRPSLQAQASFTVSQAFPLHPQDTISVMEEREAGLAKFFVFPARPESDISTKEILAFYGQRNLGSHRNSENDRHFHLLTSGESLPAPELSSRLTEMRTAIQNVLTPTVYPELSGRDRAIFQTRLSQIQQLERDLENAKRLSKEYADKITKTSTQGFIAGAAGSIEDGSNVAHAFIEMRLKVTNRNGLIRTYFWIKDYEDYAILGCFQAESAQMLPKEECYADPADGIKAKHFYPANLLKIDPISGRLDFGFEITTPNLTGLGHKARKSPEETADSFIDFQGDELAGKQLVFELFPNRIYDYLEILSGKAFIRQNDQDLYEAGVSLWDQNM